MNGTFPQQRLHLVWAGIMPLLFVFWFTGCTPAPTNLRDITPRDLVRPESGRQVLAEKSPTPDVPILPELSQEPETPPVASPTKQTPKNPSPNAVAVVNPQQQEAMKTAPGFTKPATGDSNPESETVDKDKNPYAEKLPGGMQLRVKDRTFLPEAAVSALRISFDDLDLLRVLNLDPVPLNAGEHLPDWLQELDGKRVIVRGFMYPPLTETGIQYFQLARDNDICCFGRNPKVYDRIGIALKPDQLTNHIQGRPFDVVGTFHIEPIDDEVELLQLYNMTDAHIVVR